MDHPAIRAMLGQAQGFRRQQRAGTRFVRQVLERRGENGRRPWPYGEPDPAGQDTGGKTEPDTCPPWTYPVGIPAPPPPERREDLCPTLTKAQEDFLKCQAREIGKEAATYIFNPYLFPTPFSQDFDIPGAQVISATDVRTPITRYKIERGHVGVLEAIGAEVPVALIPHIEIHPETNDATIKEFKRIDSNYGVSTYFAGLTYNFGSLSSPRKVFHPLQEEMSVGISMIALSGAALSLPLTVNALVRGRFWIPSVATLFWNYLKSS